MKFWKNKIVTFCQQKKTFPVQAMIFTIFFKAIDVRNTVGLRRRESNGIYRIECDEVSPVFHPESSELLKQNKRAISFETALYQS